MLIGSVPWRLASNHELTAALWTFPLLSDMLFANLESTFASWTSNIERHDFNHLSMANVRP
jgi:hypothetical protein